MNRPPACPSRCNVLLIGGGGREHALAWKLKQSSRLGKLWLTNPGNAGLSKLGRPCPHNDLSDTFRIQRWLDQENIHLVVVGPEVPLADGIADALATEHRQVFGPTRDAARLEWDKAYAKQMMRSVALPTAEGRIFTDASSARTWLESRDETEPSVVKASGLAAGKGAIVCDNRAEALAAIELIMVERAFGEAGDTVVIEERLTGQEVSVLALVDGRTIWMLDPCQDHKQVAEGDTGPNTGGMGAYCPAPVLDAETLATVERHVLVPIVDALRRQGVTYRGVLYAGLMLTPGGPKVLEFNCRFGDPECQPLMARMQGDLVEIMWATCTGTLDTVDIGWDPRTACCVVMCSAGYPGKYAKGKTISGIEDAEALSTDDEQVVVFHAGTTINHEGNLVTHGGRVLGVTALSSDLQAARDLANRACDAVSFEGAFYRRDIGDRVLAAQR